MTNLYRTHTDIQYKQNTKLSDGNNIYLVMSSLDLFWLYKTNEYINKYLTTLKLIGTINKEVTNDNTNKELNTNNSNDTNSDVH